MEATPVLAAGLFDHRLQTFGCIEVPDHPLRFGFQLDLVPSQTESRQVVFALVAQDGAPGSRPGSHGFAIRLDLETGEVWDILNESGLIGWVEKPLGSFSDEEPMLLNWEVEHYGAALIPKLQIANEVFLYPAVRCMDGMVMKTFAGCETGSEAMPSFMHPAVWRESL